MNTEIKSVIIALKVTPTEKAEIKATAEKNGFKTISAFLYWLLKKYGK